MRHEDLACRLHYSVLWLLGGGWVVRLDLLKNNVLAWKSNN